MESIQLADIYRAAAQVALEPFGDSIDGSPLAEVVCVTSKVFPLPDDVHDALRKAFVALGYPDEEIFMVGCKGMTAEAVLTCVEAVDPLVCIAIDEPAARMLASAYGIAPFPAGNAVMAHARRLVALDDFGAALADPARKRIAWEELKAARRPDSPL